MSSDKSQGRQPKHKAATFEGLLDRLGDGTSGDTVTVRDLMDVIGRRAYGPIILVLGFVSVSPLTIVPGANWLLATVIWIFAIQIVFGRKYPWIPKKALETGFPREYLLKAIETGRPWARGADGITQPRFTILTEPPFVNLIAAACVGAALMTYPLGLVPLGPILPGIAITLAGVGLAARDGVFLMLAGAALAGAVVMMIKLADRFVEMFANVTF